VVNNFRDIEEDRSTGKITLAVIFGNTFSKIEFIVLLIISFIVPLLLFSFYNFSYWISLPYISLPIAVTLIKMLSEYKGSDLNKTLELTAKFSAIYGLLFSTGILL
ncbi:MAG: UbiA family prenyltransferase, partial [Ignavibacteriaceae bacterium]|nr:UbiA family prenyltransferase [Ignavibacteriaceae bacterium]